MKIKRNLYRWFRRRRRNLARFILGFDDCPVDNRKSFKDKILYGIAVTFISACIIFAFAFFAIATM
ncbi:hypothetical protein [Treponema sp.]|uniref:hypothetical protein n=1 Tax=Treponema sp. TaxID=166 RepID=UPI003F04FA34